MPYHNVESNTVEARPLGVPRALDELNDEINQLQEEVERLMDRLKPISLTPAEEPPIVDLGNKVLPRERAYLTEQINNFTNSVRRITSTVARAMHNLEV